MPVRIRLLAVLAMALVALPATSATGCEDCTPQPQVIQDGMGVLPPVPPPATPPRPQVIDDPVEVLPPPSPAEPHVAEPEAVQPEPSEPDRSGSGVGERPTGPPRRSSADPAGARPRAEHTFVMPRMGVGHTGRYPI